MQVGIEKAVLSFYPFISLSWDPASHEPPREAIVAVVGGKGVPSKNLFVMSSLFSRG